MAIVYLDKAAPAPPTPHPQKSLTNDVLLAVVGGALIGAGSVIPVGLLGVVVLAVFYLIDTAFALNFTVMVTSSPEDWPVALRDDRVVAFGQVTRSISVYVLVVWALVTLTMVVCAVRRPFADTSLTSRDDGQGMSASLLCNQCGKTLKDKRNGVGMAFNLGHGPVYVCVECAPPMSREETIRQITNFIKGVDASE